MHICLTRRMQRNNQTPANEPLIPQIRRRLLTNRMARHPTGERTFGARAAQRITTTWSSRVASVERSTRALHPLPSDHYHDSPHSRIQHFHPGMRQNRRASLAQVEARCAKRYHATMPTWHMAPPHMARPSRFPSVRPSARSQRRLLHGPSTYQQTSSPVGSLGDDSIIRAIQAPVFDASGTVSPPRLDKRSVFLHDTTTDRSGNLSSHCPSPSSCTPTSHSWAW